MAGSIYDDETGHSRISFVMEGEASLHFCMQNELVNNAKRLILSCFAKESVDHVSRRRLKDF